MVIAIAVSLIMGDCELWLAFGHCAHFWHFVVLIIAIEMGVYYEIGVLFMHALNGCGYFIYALMQENSIEIWKSF